MLQSSLGIRSKSLLTETRELGRDSLGRDRFGVATRFGCAFSLALLLAMGAGARQSNQQQDSQPNPPQQQSQQGDQSSPPPASTSTQDQTQNPPAASAPSQTPNRPKYASQDADKPPYSKDYPTPRAGTGPRTARRRRPARTAR